MWKWSYYTEMGLKDPLSVSRVLRSTFLTVKSE